MSVRVLFFGATAAAVGTHELVVELSGGTNVRDILDHLLSANPVLNKQSLLFSVNQEYAVRETLVSDGDELAIFTPVSGG